MFARNSDFARAEASAWSRARLVAQPIARRLDLGRVAADLLLRPLALGDVPLDRDEPLDASLPIGDRHRFEVAPVARAVLAAVRQLHADRLAGGEPPPEVGARLRVEVRV